MPTRPLQTYGCTRSQVRRAQTHHPSVLVDLRLFHVIHRNGISVFDPNLGRFPGNTLRKSPKGVDLWTRRAPPHTDHYGTQLRGSLWFIPRALYSYQTSLGLRADTPAGCSAPHATLYPSLPRSCIKIPALKAYIHVWEDDMRCNPCSPRCDKDVSGYRV